MFYDPFIADFTEDLSGILNRAVCGYRQVLSGGLAEATPDRATQSSSGQLKNNSCPDFFKASSAMDRAGQGS